MDIIPTFMFNSIELLNFKEQHMIDENYTFKYLDGYWYNSLPITIKDTRKIWAKSGIQYIVDHGSFKTLETSIAYQQNTISKAL